MAKTRAQYLQMAKIDLILEIDQLEARNNALKKQLLESERQLTNSQTDFNNRHLDNLGYQGGA